MGLEKHIGKKIEVRIGVFTSILACSLVEEIQEGILAEYEEETGYCRYSIDGIIKPPIHESSVKLIL